MTSLVALLLARCSIQATAGSAGKIVAFEARGQQQGRTPPSFRVAPGAQFRQPDILIAPRLGDTFYADEFSVAFLKVFEVLSEFLIGRILQGGHAERARP